jgi:hypothetical protein
MKSFYLVCALLGTLVPYGQFVPWVAQHGFDPARFVAELFSTRIGAFFGLDVIVSAVCLFGFIFVEGRRRRVSHRWLPCVATLLAGVSCGLPLFLYLRERSGAAAQA